MKNKQFQQEKQKIWLRQKCRDIIPECRNIISKEPTEDMLQQRSDCCDMMEIRR